MDDLFDLYCSLNLLIVRLHDILMPILHEYSKELLNKKQRIHLALLNLD
jgi:hypothetical protein